jgi:hypothetical protein
MAKKRNARNWDAPQYHADHPRPVTRRQLPFREPSGGDGTVS